MPGTVGRAAHPSLQKLTNDELRERLADREQRLRDHERDYGHLVAENEDAADLIAGDSASVDALKLALRWRGAS